MNLRLKVITQLCNSCSDQGSMSNVLPSGMFLSCLDNEVYAWGNNSMGQCGQGNSTGPITKPKKVVGLDGVAVQQISAGTSHSLAWTALPRDRSACHSLTAELITQRSGLNSITAHFFSHWSLLFFYCFMFPFFSIWNVWLLGSNIWHYSTCSLTAPQASGGLAQALLRGPGREHFLPPALLPGALLWRDQQWRAPLALPLFQVGRPPAAAPPAGILTGLSHGWCSLVSQAVP